MQNSKSLKLNLEESPETLLITKSGDLNINLKIEDEIEINHTLILEMAENSIQADINIRCAIYSKSKVKLMVIVRTPSGIKNIKSSLDMQALLLHKYASIEFVPSLEIEDKDVSIDHKSTIGVPDASHLEYLQSRGFMKDEAIDLIANSFFTDAK